MHENDFTINVPLRKFLVFTGIEYVSFEAQYVYIEDASVYFVTNKVIVASFMKWDYWQDCSIVFDKIKC